MTLAVSATVPSEGMEVTLEEWGQRKTFVDFDNEDARLLHAVRLFADEHADDIVEALYVRLLAFEETRTFFPDPAMIARVKASQRQYVLELFGGEYGAAYLENRLRVGRAHHRIGLPPWLYVGAFSHLRQILIPRLTRALWLHPDAEKTVFATLKLMSLDMELAITTYTAAAEASLREYAEQLGAINQFAGAINGTLDLDSVLRLVLGEIPRIVPCTWCAVVRQIAAPNTFAVAAGWARDAALVAPSVSSAADESASGAVRENGAPCAAQDTRDTSVRPLFGLPLGAVASYISVPIFTESTFWGTLDVGFGSAGAATGERVQFLVGLSAHVSSAIRNADLHTRLADAFQEIKDAQERVVEQQRLSALGQMAAGIAHDFNNALAPILGFTELLLDSPETLEDRAQTTRYLEIMRDSAEHAAGVVRGLREFSRPLASTDAFAPVDLNGVLQHALQLAQPRWSQAQAAGGNVSVDSRTEEVPAVLGNETQLQEALLNLILNAVDALEGSGGGLIISTHHDEHGVAVEVADNGPGMDEQVRTHCLEPFFTTKGARGTGLGLPMVYGIVGRHAGRLEIESEVGVGTTMRVWLPSLVEESPAASIRAASAPQSTARILIVDDEPAAREFVSTALAREGYLVETAADGGEGLEKFRSGRFSLVITDRAMPVMNGDQLAAAVKADSLQTPVLLLTGFGDLMDPLGDHPRGVDRVLSKPVNLGALREAVRDALAALNGDSNPRTGAPQ